MPRWLDWLRGESGAPRAGAAWLPPEGPALGLPPNLPPGVDGALWAPWVSRWQEF